MRNAKLTELLFSENLTCVLSDGKETFESRERGIAPLLRLIGSGKDFRGFSAADKVVGKAAALLYACMGISELYAGVLGDAARPVLLAHGISFEYGKTAERIINRGGDGICPMEKAVAPIDEPFAARAVLESELRRISGRE